MKWYYWLIAFTWELPQTVLFLLMFPFVGPCRNAPTVYPNNKRFYTRWVNGVSLGRLIYLWENYGPGHQVVQHERGHSVQSLIFGPLYLVVVGIPSAFFNLLTRLGILNPGTYYTRYPENWADRLGGVERGPV